MEFKEYKGTGKDADGNDLESTIEAHEVNDESKGQTITTVGGASRKLNKGDVVVKTDRDGVYDVHDADSWKNSGYGGSVAKSDDKDDKPNPPPVKKP